MSGSTVPTGVQGWQGPFLALLASNDTLTHVELGCAAPRHPVDIVLLLRLKGFAKPQDAAYPPILPRHVVGARKMALTPLRLRLGGG